MMTASCLLLVPEKRGYVAAAAGSSRGAADVADQVIARVASSLQSHQLGTMSSRRSSSPLRGCHQQQQQHYLSQLRMSGRKSLCAPVARTKVETPEVDDNDFEITVLATSEASADEKVISTVVRPILYPTCTGVHANDADNNVSADDAVFYKRLGSSDDGSDDENNPEFDSDCGVRDHNQLSDAESDDEEEAESWQLQRRRVAIPPLEIHSNQISEDTERRTSTYCDLMVQYELESVTKVQQQQQSVLSRFARRTHTTSQVPQQSSTPDLRGPERGRFSRCNSQNSDDEDDLVNICSPVARRGVGGAMEALRAATTQSGNSSPQKQREHRQQERTTSDHLAQYNEVLTFLQEACATRSPEISIPGVRLAQMEALLRSLHPSVRSER